MLKASNVKAGTQQHIHTQIPEKTGHPPHVSLNLFEHGHIQGPK
jgi:hypothetical protein